MGSSITNDRTLNEELDLVVEETQSLEEASSLHRDMMTFAEVLLVKICEFLTVKEFVRFTTTSKVFTSIRWDDFAWSMMTGRKKLPQMMLYDGQWKLGLLDRTISNVTLLSKWLKNTSRVECLV